MENRHVNKSIAKKIKPLLQQRGFEAVSARNYLRYKKDRIEVINFQSFNSYQAEGMGCTTFSFAINLGILFLCVPHESIKLKDGKLLPKEYECDFRRRLYKAGSDIFSITSDGSNLDEVIEDAVTLIQNDAINWFAEFDDMKNVLNTLINANENMAGTWGFGNNSSPKRNYLTGFVAKNLCLWEIAGEAFKRVIDYKIMSDSYVTKAYEEITTTKNSF